MESVLRPAHALLGASSSHRWLHCTPCARLEAAVPDSGSSFAREGSLAHAMGARTLKRMLGLPHDGEDEEIAGLWDEFHTPEMDAHVEGYAGFVATRYADARKRAGDTGRLLPDILIEQCLDYSPWVPEGFGTGDAVIAGEGVLEIIDLKYGKGVPVSAMNNTQMMLYALGVYDLLDYAFGFREVVMTIYQPRLGNVSTWNMPMAGILRWAEEKARPAAELAWRGEGERKAGGWCRFCKVKAGCPARVASDFDGFFNP